jgi:gas vesicle protein
MRFIIGLLLGFAAGFAGAILFAPEKKHTRVHWPEGHPAAGGISPNGNRRVSGSLQNAIRSVQDRVNEAWEEARKASEQAEKDMQARYQESAGRRAESKK